MRRILAFLYGLVAYALFLGVFLYLVGFVGNLAVPRSVDAAPAGSLPGALLVDLLLVGAFAVQHSVMARPGFKRLWTRLVPASVERSTYVLLSSLALALLFWQWRALPTTVWAVRDPVGAALLEGVRWVGWSMVLVSTFMIDHFRLFGVKQVLARLTRRRLPGARFVTPFLYRLVRHPIMLGFLVAFWAAPVMTVGHLLFAAGFTGYILVGVRLEERDLVALFGEDYERYRRTTPAFLPVPKPSPGSGREGERERRPVAGAAPGPATGEGD